MATVTGMTAAAMQAILDGTVESAAVVGDNLILTLHDSSTINAGNVRGPQGTQGVPGDIGTGSPAGGDLAGSTYPNPVIAAGVITDTKVAAANKDGIPSKASLRTLGTGSQQAAAGNHTHDAAAIISGILGIARLPVASSGESDSSKVARSDDGRFPDFSALGLKIKVGSVTVNISASTTGTATVNFTGTPFTNTPIVIGCCSTATSSLIGSAEAPTTTSFTARLFHKDSTSSTTSATVSWIAIGT